MGQYKIIVKDKARKDLQKHHKSGNRAITRRIEQIFIELEDHPETGIGNPEQLKHEYSGFWSRRLSSEHRLIYRINEETVEVLVVSALGHYQSSNLFIFNLNHIAVPVQPLLANRYSGS